MLPLIIKNGFYHEPLFQTKLYAMRTAAEASSTSGDDAYSTSSNVTNDSGDQFSVEINSSLLEWHPSGNETGLEESMWHLIDQAVKLGLKVDFGARLATSFLSIKVGFATTVTFDGEEEAVTEDEEGIRGGGRVTFALCLCYRGISQASGIGISRKFMDSRVLEKIGFICPDLENLCIKDQALTTESLSFWT
ncbi:hypothetical protein K1719_038355 [Acacia pycnantha]|nr:hypothetical protein K1719_038355 [Acacia pycnantha]